LSLAANISTETVSFTKPEIPAHTNFREISFLKPEILKKTKERKKWGVFGVVCRYYIMEGEILEDVIG